MVARLLEGGCLSSQVDSAGLYGEPGVLPAVVSVMRVTVWGGWQLKETIGLLLADLNRALLAKVMPHERIYGSHDQYDHRRRPPAGVVVLLGSRFLSDTARS